MSQRKMYYEILEVREQASTAEIKRSYHILAKKYHPDKNTESDNTEQKFKDINEAYQCLVNRESRLRYDQLLEQDRRRFANVPTAEPSAFNFQQPEFAQAGSTTDFGSEYVDQMYFERQPGMFDSHIYADFNNLDDVFETFFSSMESRAATRDPFVFFDFEGDSEESTPDFFTTAENDVYENQQTQGPRYWQPPQMAHHMYSNPDNMGFFEQPQNSNHFTRYNFQQPEYDTFNVHQTQPANHIQGHFTRQATEDVGNAFTGDTPQGTSNEFNGFQNTGKSSYPSFSPNNHPLYEMYLNAVNEKLREHNSHKEQTSENLQSTSGNKLESNSENEHIEATANQDRQKRKFPSLKKRKNNSARRSAAKQETSSNKKSKLSEKAASHVSNETKSHSDGSCWGPSKTKLESSADGSDFFQHGTRPRSSTKRTISQNDQNRKTTSQKETGNLHSKASCSSEGNKGYQFAPGMGFNEGTVFAGTNRFGSACTFGASCQFKHPCNFGGDSRFDQRCMFSNNSAFESGCNFGAMCVFGERSHFKPRCNFGSGCRVGDMSYFGSGCKFGHGVILGNHCQIGAFCEFSKEHSFGHGCNFAFGCRF